MMSFALVTCGGGIDRQPATIYLYHLRGIETFRFWWHPRAGLSPVTRTKKADIRVGICSLFIQTI